MADDQRSTSAPSFVLWLGGHRLDLEARVLSDPDGRRIELRAQSMRVLCFLAARNGAIATKDEILDACWPSLTVTEDSLTQCIADIRRALGPQDRDAVKTAPRQGYFVTGTTVGAMASSGAADQPHRRQGLLRRHWQSVAAAALFGLLILGLLGDRLIGSRPEPDGDGATLLAVLPFENMTADPAVAYFVDGTTEYLMASLARSPDLRVVGGATVVKAAGPHRDPTLVRSQLKATYLLEGSVAKSPDRVRIVAELIDTATGEHVWAHRYDRSGGDPFEIQDGVVSDIVHTVAGDSGLITRHRYAAAWGKDTGSLEEWDYYLRGHSTFMTFTPEGLNQAEAIWTEGLSKYPQSSLLKVKLAYVGFVRVQSGWVADPDVVLKRSWDLGTSALANPKITPLARTLGHMLMSELNFYFTKDYDRAMMERAAVLEMSPNDFFMRADLAYVAVGSGHPDLAIASLPDIDPDRPLADWGYAALTWAYFAVRDYPASIRAAKAAFNPVPAYADAFEAASWSELGDLEKARVAYAKLEEELPEVSASRLRVVHQNRDREVIDREISALRKLGLPD